MHILEEFKSISSTRKDLRSFGFVVGGVLTAFAIISWYRGGHSTSVFGVPGIALVIGALLMPRALLPLQKVWMGLAVMLGWVMTRVIISTLFFVIVTPTGLLMRMMGKKFLVQSFDKKAISYWERRPVGIWKKENYEHQF
ncbi:MAG: hypothetical protein EXS68_00915 [Candidatus Ryanbacteria bacterium]|nr:hypothetical protein [Candidatus Ryanbacteria bacterium]